MSAFTNLLNQVCYSHIPPCTNPRMVCLPKLGAEAESRCERFMPTTAAPLCLCLLLWPSPMPGFGCCTGSPHSMCSLQISPFFSPFAIRFVGVLHPPPPVRIAHLYHHPTTLGLRNTCSPQHRAFEMRPFRCSLSPCSCSFSVFQYYLYCIGFEIISLCKPKHALQ